MSNLREILIELLDDGYETHGLICKVTAVNGMNCECEPINGNAPITDVRLVADDSTAKFVLVPKVGSVVVVEFLNNAAGYIAMVSEVEKVVLKVGTVQYEIDMTGFLIKKGNDTAKDLLTKLVEAVLQIVVINGNNPDYNKLAQVLVMINNIFK